MERSNFLRALGALLMLLALILPVTSVGAAPDTTSSGGAIEIVSSTGGAIEAAANPILPIGSAFETASLTTSAGTDSSGLGVTTSASTSTVSNYSCTITYC